MRRSGVNRVRKILRGGGGGNGGGGGGGGGGDNGVSVRNVRNMTRIKTCGKMEFLMKMETENFAQKNS